VNVELFDLGRQAAAIGQNREASPGTTSRALLVHSGNRRDEDGDQSMQDFMLEELREIYSAERLVLRAYPRLRKTLETQPLRETVENVTRNRRRTASLRFRTGGDVLVPSSV